MTETPHEAHMREALSLAEIARTQGNAPYGALLVHENTIIARAQNTTTTDNDPTAHAELNLVRQAGGDHDAAFLAECTLYTSAEPCAMCAGAIYMAGIGTVVYGCPIPTQLEVGGGGGLPVRAETILQHGGITVIGSILADEAAAVLAGDDDTTTTHTAETE